MLLRKRFVCTVLTALCIVVLTGTLAYAGSASPWSESMNIHAALLQAGVAPDAVRTKAAMAPGVPANFDDALVLGADYLQAMQADVTEDNAGNGNPDSPDDPDDGGWDWAVTSPPAPYSHTTSASPTNIYGATAQGLLYAYLETSNAGYFTAMTDAAGVMAANAGIRSGADLVYLMEYDDLPAVAGTTYQDAARAKYDARMVAYGGSKKFADSVAYIRGAYQGYPNGIIAWDLGIWARAAAMLDARYPGNGYDADADSIAEVLWEDSFNSNPGYFDIIADQGFDPLYGNVNYYWYNLGITGLIDAFDAAGVHTGEIPGLVSILLDGQALHGGVSYCYGANPGDDDWQSTAYAAMTLARLDQPTYQTEINAMGYYLAATQHASGAWQYSSGNHYPEIAGECTAALYFTTNVTVFDLSDVRVDDDFTWQADVDLFNIANNTGYIFGYDAFGTIQGGIDVVSGSTVHVEAGVYNESVIIDKGLELIGAGGESTEITGGMQLTGSLSGLVLDGLYIHGDAAGWKTAVIDSRPITGTADDITLRNCVIDGEDVSARMCFYGTNITGTWRWEGNEIRNFPTWYVLDNTGSQHDIPYKMDSVFFVDNYVHNCGGSMAFRGKIDEPTVYALISGNTCNAYKPSAVSEVWAAIEINNVTLLEVHNNVINDVPEASWGGEGQPLQIWSASPWTVDIHNNDFSGNFQGIYIWSLLEASLWSGGDTPLYVPAGGIYDNDLTNATFSVWISDLPVGGGTSSAIGGPLDASGNYFGTTDGSVIAGLVSANVDYTPWLAGGTNSVTGFDGDFSLLYVDDDSPQSGSDGRIQEGVYKVSGSTINVMAGTYDETINIDAETGINIVGEDKTTTIIKSSTTIPWNIAPYGAARQTVVRIVGSTDINISGLTLDGDLIKGNNKFVVTSWNSTGSFSDNIFQNMNVSDASGGYAEFLCYVRAPGYTDAARAHTSFTGNVFRDGGRVSLITHQYVDVTVTGNEFYKTAADFGYAMEIGSESTGDITGNTIYGFNTPALSDGSNSAGIYVENAFTGATPTMTKTVTVTGNEVYDCQWAVYAGNEFDGYAGDVDIDLTMSGNSFHDNTDGAVLLTDEDKSAGSSVNATCHDNTILDNGGYGYFIKTDGDGDMTALITDELIMGHGLGAFVHDYGTSSTSAYDVTFYGNSFVNTVNATDDVSGTAWDDGVAIGNCWSDFYTNSGFPTQYDVPGTAAGIDHHPSVDCGVDMSPDNIVYHCSGNLSFDVGIGNTISGLEAANMTIQYPASMVFAGATSASSNYTVVPIVYDNASGYDSVRVGVGVLTGSENGPATLFTIELNGSDDICTGDQISMVYQDLRDASNLPNSIVAPLPTPITLTVDCEDPVLTVSTADGGFYNVAPDIDLGATDNCDLDAVYYQIDGCTPGGWTALASGLSGTSYGPTNWVLPAPDWSALSEAGHCIRFKVTDDNGRGNADSCSFTWCFTKDITPPSPPTDLVATPGHNKVHLSWTNAASDFDHTVIMRNDWYGGGHGYPEYDDDVAEGPYPSDTSSSDYIYAGTLGTLTDTDDLSNATRDVYHYSAFTVDAAGNVSAPSGGARATSYWLGDVAGGGGLGDYDGSVYFEDLAVFSTTFGKSHGDAGYQNEFDIGPTVTYSPKGIPTTDNIIEFEDLSIFAINFDAVSPAGKLVPLFVTGDDNPSNGGPLSLDLVSASAIASGEEFDVAVMLRNNTDRVKSVRFVIPYETSQMELVRVTQGPGLRETAVPVFFHSADAHGRVDVNLAVLGNGLTLGGSGELATLTFRARSESAINFDIELADMRDNENNKLDAITNGTVFTQASAVPRTYGLGQNYPNPFNASTSIQFDVRTAGDVSLRVFNVNGQLVRTLAAGHYEAGSYTITWNGRGDNGREASSGVYFYRMVIGEFDTTRKMLLLK